MCFKAMFPTTCSQARESNLRDFDIAATGTIAGSDFPSENLFKATTHANGASPISWLASTDVPLGVRKVSQFPHNPAAQFAAI